MKIKTVSYYQRMMNKIAAQQLAIGKQRDKLGDLISELESLKQDCDEAYDAMQSAVDALSRLV
jgi:uncharacterized coiled-coil protein SlyX